MEDSDINKKLMAAKKELLYPPQKKVAESRRLPPSRFHKLNRIGRYSRM